MAETGRQIDPDDVASWLRLSPGTDPDTLAAVSAAATDWINVLPVVDALPEDSDWTPRIRLGDTMLASRLYRRRNSPSGIDQVSDVGVAYVARSDADVSMLLALDNYTPPATA